MYKCLCVCIYQRVCLKRFCVVHMCECMRVGDMSECLDVCLHRCVNVLKCPDMGVYEGVTVVICVYI